jgi:uncharacterized repeat protein (TIGR01451 family)
MLVESIKIKNMFEKLLSVLPYNPGLASQMRFYSRRMREEAGIRRIGMVFIVLTFMVQFFAVLSPPQPTTASSNNDIINGGISSAGDAKANCLRNTENFKEILAYYGIGCDDFNGADTVTLNSGSQNYVSMGRLPFGSQNQNTGRATNEQPVNIPGAGRLYVRSLDSFGTTSYRALKLRNADGKVFYILYNCGNIVSINVPQPYTPCEFDRNLPKNSPQCFEHCPVAGKTGLPKNSPQCFDPCPYNKAIPAKSAACFDPCVYNKSIPKSSPKCYPPCQYNPLLNANDPKCKPCDKSTSSVDAIACVFVSKAASNSTTGTPDANNTTVKASDVIVYTLSAKNNGKAVVKGYVFEEDLSDVLDYATVVDLHGGTISNRNVVSWAKQDIKAGATASHQITVKVKSPIPATPTGSSDPGHFDLVMTNVYGNAININLPATPAKTIETTAATLPNTGPGTNLLIATFIVVVAGYFYGRARLLAQESDLAIKELA